MQENGFFQDAPTFLLAYSWDSAPDRPHWKFTTLSKTSYLDPLL